MSSDVAHHLGGTDHRVRDRRYKHQNQKRKHRLPSEPHVPRQCWPHRNIAYRIFFTSRNTMLLGDHFDIYHHLKPSSGEIASNFV